MQPSHIEIDQILLLVYYRHGPTWEWDTAAGHAVVLAAGGGVESKKQNLTYNKPQLKNDSFLVSSSHFS